MTSSYPEPAWKVVAASVAGPHHVRDGLPCQDAFSWRVIGERLVAAISDGAGSAAQSEQGSRILSQCVVDAFAENVAAPLQESEVRRIAEQAIEACRTQLLQTYPDANLADFHATLAAVVMDDRGGFVLQIGDGMAAAVQERQWAPCLLCLPENGDYAEETFFFTLDGWRRHLRITPVPADYDELILVTDGAYSFTAKPAANGLDRDFIAPVCAFLEQNDEERGVVALKQILDHANARRISGDDKTLLWAKRKR
ncbi:protein phosphatase 2C domain-containing protein [Hahella sp. KA22]|uniref:PP2C family serine/threonine-protein phosphatase n=1 Tax=Hahella sp. KA22 TaxID=1628392 RepID=UPI000FDCF3B1|nr:PP2C family serine/threonine-protein phosphatase [Hahella sp. KA22]AZZ90334.1 protein phosphatase 2C domain-containing protein [Hahella sp. KA22]QAY53705.1 protein phosphatase 2C domain-containing protein [Hahella sp. KA22]